MTKWGTVWVAGVHNFQFYRWYQTAHISSGTILLSLGYCFSTPTHRSTKLLIFVYVMGKKNLTVLPLYFPGTGQFCCLFTHLLATGVPSSVNLYILHPFFCLFFLTNCGNPLQLIHVTYCFIVYDSSLGICVVLLLGNILNFHGGSLINLFFFFRLELWVCVLNLSFPTQRS